MKLGGLTWWRNNYGSILQAYALQEKLNSYEDVEYEIICQYGKKIASASNLKDKIKHFGIVKTAQRLFWKFGLRKLRARNAKIQRFIDTHLIVSKKEYDEETISQANEVYDGFICGSDQIWNPALEKTTSIYWLKFAAKGKIKVSYAPSIGVNSFSAEQKAIIRDNLSDFTAISSREESGTKLINEALNSDRCETVLDPTMLVNRSMWDHLTEHRLFPEKYMFVYMLRGTKKQRNLIEEFAKMEGLKIVTMPFLDTEKIELYDFLFGDVKLWEADPADFINAIRYAEYVFTDSFHSMVFSCLYHTDFFTFPKIGTAQLNRVVELQDMLQIKGRMISEDDPVSEWKAIDAIDWARVDAVLHSKRMTSNAYLDRIFMK